MSSLEELFCELDDFWIRFEPKWESKLLAQGLKTRRRERRLRLSEMMTILVAFHQNHYRNFKHYYIAHVLVHWREACARIADLPTVCGMDALYLIATMCLFEALFWSM